jgi:hypothetical protein
MIQIYGAGIAPAVPYRLSDKSRMALMLIFVPSQGMKIMAINKAAAQIRASEAEVLKVQSPRVVFLAVAIGALPFYFE